MNILITVTQILFHLLPFSKEIPTTADFACNVYIPNAFSPNEDGFNDTFAPFLGVDCQLSAYQLRVYDRWGGLVFESAAPEEAWDGNQGTDPAAIGPYLYVLEYTFADANGEPEAEVASGVLNLLR